MSIAFRANGKQCRLGETPVCFELLPAEFTLSELQALCEAILGAHRLIRPFDPRARHGRRVDVRQIGLEQQHLTRLLTRGDNKRGLVLICGEKRPHPIAEAGSGVEVDERRLARRLRETVCHSDD